MTAVFIAIALKSLLVTGLTLGLLAWCRDRSPAERSCIAHFGLAALLVVALAPLAMPRWEVEAPAWIESAMPRDSQQQQAAEASSPSVPGLVSQSAAAPEPGTGATAPALLSILYALPAFALLILTLVAIARLLALRARAEVLVDGHWLSALARAQRRMGFKHGTALLTSNDLDSPISWGLMRPVILLNRDAVAATGQAEAIIAHELAHVARLDWIKLLLARVVTALFWFNPLVWLLAREAHQLREESADDAVLAADIADTDYAELLVGVARHDCPGLLLGAHGVAPSRNSLSRRIRRVLDRTLARGPAARHFALGVLAGATLVAAPLAALTISPSTSDARTAPSSAGRIPLMASEAADVPADLPSLIAAGVESAVETMPQAAAMTDAEEAAIEARLEAQERVAEAMAAAHEAQAEAMAAAHEARAEAHGQTARAVAEAGKAAALAARTAHPRNARSDDLAGLHVLGVTPAYARELAAAGYPNLDPGDLAAARTMGVTGQYAREMAAAGIRPPISELIAMRTLGVSPSFVAKARSQGHDVRDSDRLIELFLTGSHR